MWSLLSSSCPCSSASRTISGDTQRAAAIRARTQAVDQPCVASRAQIGSPFIDATCSLSTRTSPQDPNGIPFGARGQQTTSRDGRGGVTKPLLRSTPSLPRRSPRHFPHTFSFCAYYKAMTSSRDASSDFRSWRRDRSSCPPRRLRGWGAGASDMAQANGATRELEQKALRKDAAAEQFTQHKPKTTNT